MIKRSTYHLNSYLKNRPMTQLSSWYYPDHTLQIWTQSLHQNFSLVTIRFFRNDLGESGESFLVEEFED